MDTTMQVESQTPPRAKVLWQCRRGMLELDMILQPFCETEYDSLTDLQKKDFVQLLQFSDPLLYEWLLGKTETLTKNIGKNIEVSEISGAVNNAETEKNLSAMVQLIRSYRTVNVQAS